MNSILPIQTNIAAQDRPQWFILGRLPLQPGLPEKRTLLAQRPAGRDLAGQGPWDDHL